jgi:hypothetical protein
MLHTIRNWLIKLLGGQLPTEAGADKQILVEDVPFRDAVGAGLIDMGLTQRTRTQWHFGDWASLAQLQREAIHNHPDRAHLALMAAAGRLQTGADMQAREYIALAQEWGCSKVHLSQVLISGVHNSLGRAASVLGDPNRALDHYCASLHAAAPGDDARLLTHARESEQLFQLGVQVLDRPAPSFSRTGEVKKL